MSVQKKSQRVTRRKAYFCSIFFAGPKLHTAYYKYLMPPISIYNLRSSTLSTAYKLLSPFTFVAVIFFDVAQKLVQNPIALRLRLRLDNELGWIWKMFENFGSVLGSKKKNSKIWFESYIFGRTCGFLGVTSLDLHAIYILYEDSSSMFFGNLRTILRKDSCQILPRHIFFRRPKFIKSKCYITFRIKSCEKVPFYSDVPIIISSV